MCIRMDRNYESRAAALVPAEALASEASWDSALFLRGQLRFGWPAAENRPLESLADVFEGTRTPQLDEDPISIYRARSISPFELTPSPEQWLTASSPNPRAIQPGDVILKRVAPVTAAVAGVGMPKLPVDANCFVVRGLVEADAWWLAFFLNDPACVDYLLSKSGRGVLSRVSLSVLRQWSMPATPAGFARLARRLAECLAKRTFLAGQIAALKAEVETAVGAQMDATDYERSEERFAQRSWAFFFPAILADVSWLPLHVANAYRSDVLNRDREWRPLCECLLPSSPSRQRWSQLDSAIPVLRLSDVGDVPLVPHVLPAAVPPQANRVFREPLAPEDVLLSTLGSSPRIAFTPAHLEPIYAVDHWERLRFREHAAAFALILQTSAVARQLRSLAGGSIQQFVRPEDLQHLFLPAFPSDVMGRWDRSFRSLCKTWAQTETDWLAALAEGNQFFTRASKSTQHPL